MKAVVCASCGRSVGITHDRMTAARRQVVLRVARHNQQDRAPREVVKNPTLCPGSGVSVTPEQVVEIDRRTWRDAALRKR